MDSNISVLNPEQQAVYEYIITSVFEARGRLIGFDVQRENGKHLYLIILVSIRQK